jgi:hypothetical protein
VLVDRDEERGDDVVAAGGPVRGARQQVAGMVVEPVEDLDVGLVCQAPVRDVGLPGLVGLGCLKAGVGGPRALARLSDDEPGLGEDPADRRRRGRVEAFLLEVPGDRQGPGIRAVAGQFASQLDDPCSDEVRGRGRMRLGAA